MKETSFSVTNSCVKPVFVNDGTRLLRLDVEDIFYVEAEDHYCHVYKANGKRVCTLSMQLGAVLSALNDGSFVQISRYEFVNIWHIREIIGNLLILEDGNRLTISRNFRGRIEDFLCVLTEIRS